MSTSTLRPVHRAFLAIFGITYGGIYNRWVARRASRLGVPALDDPGLIAIGAQHYGAMCAACHLAPGMSETELHTGLNPQPPNLVLQGAFRDPAQSFWIVKNEPPGR